MRPRDLIIILILAIFAIIFFVITNYKNLKPNFNENDEFGNGSSYKCPKTEYIDCMPSPDGNGSSRNKLCDDQKFLDWATANCPNFKGGAL